MLFGARAASPDARAPAPAAAAAHQVLRRRRLGRDATLDAHGRRRRPRPRSRRGGLGARTGGRPNLAPDGGVAAARDGWLALLDGDVESGPTKLAEQLQALAADGSDFYMRSAVRVRMRSRLRARLRPGPVLALRRGHRYVLGIELALLADDDATARDGDAHGEDKRSDSTE